MIIENVIMDQFEERMKINQIKVGEHLTAGPPLGPHDRNF